MLWFVLHAATHRNVAVRVLGAVKDESTSDCYAPREFPAVGDPRMTQVCDPPHACAATWAGRLTSIEWHRL